MIKNSLKIFFIVFALFIIQTVILNGHLLPSVPDILLVTIISCGLLCYPNLSLGIGFFGGLLFDLNYGDVIGLYAFLYFTVAFIMTKIAGAFVRESIIIPSLVIALVSVVFEMIVFVLTFLFRGRFDVGAYWDIIIAPKLVLNIIFGSIIYRLVLIIVKGYEARLEEKEKKIV